jgi:hypothetical protein
MTERPLDPWMTSSRGPFLTLNAGGTLGGIVTITARAGHVLGVSRRRVELPVAQHQGAVMPVIAVLENVPDLDPPLHPRPSRDEPDPDLPDDVPDPDAPGPVWDPEPDPEQPQPVI